jgi:hypothetical protein
MRLAAHATLALALAGPIAASKAHRHAHHHVHDRRAVAYVDAPAATVLAYEYDGQLISAAEACQGLQDGSMDWAAGSSADPCAASATPSAAGAQFLQASPSAAAATAAPSPSAQDLSDLAVNPNVDVDFPDGQLDCSTFPYDYGAIDISWMDLGGWSGIQYVQDNGARVTSIVTAIAGNACAIPASLAVPEGSYPLCSYACPAGYQKSQWPAIQGSSNPGDTYYGASVGGLKCQNGKLHLTNPSQPRLCMQGTGQVSVQNNLGANCAICRTDYPGSYARDPADPRLTWPGTESETVPLNTQPGTTSQLTCPNASTYYKHLNMATTAEYYVNMKGTSVQNACTWGTDGSSAGNWAPVVFGVGMDESGNTWLSIQSTIQNFPSTYQSLDFTVELQGNLGGSACYFVNQGGVGYYCSSGSPSTFQPSKCDTILTKAVPGCTVSSAPSRRC